MKTRFISLFAAILFLNMGTLAMAKTAPNGWSASDNGIVKGKSKVTIGEVQELEGQSVAEFLATLENMAPEGTEFVSSGGIKDGKYVAQVKREILVDGVKARSVLMVCHGGANKNRLIEIFSENSKVLDLIVGAKYALDTCAE